MFTSVFDNVSLVGVVPHHNTSLIEQFDEENNNKSALPDTYINRPNNVAHLDTWKLRQELRLELAKKKVAFMDVTNFFCDERVCKQWLDKAGGQALFWDRSHLTLPAIQALGDYIADKNLLNVQPELITENKFSYVEDNLEILNTLHDVIIKEGIPVSPKKQDINKSIPDILRRYDLSLIMPANREGLIGYRSDDGKSYKLLMYDTGDCGLLLQIKPELVDRKSNRFKQGHNCRAYGYWSKTGASRY